MCSLFPHLRVSVIRSEFYVSPWVKERKQQGRGRREYTYTRVYDIYINIPRWSACFFCDNSYSAYCAKGDRVSTARAGYSFSFSGRLVAARRREKKKREDPVEAIFGEAERSRLRSKQASARPSERRRRLALCPTRWIVTRVRIPAEAARGPPPPRAELCRWSNK